MFWRLRDWLATLENFGAHFPSYLIYRYACLLSLTSPLTIIYRGVDVVHIFAFPTHHPLKAIFYINF